MLPRIRGFRRSGSLRPSPLTKGHFKLKRRDERLGVLHGIIDGDARACRVHESVDRVEVNEFWADVFEGEQVPLLAVTLEHSFHAKGEGSAHLAGLFADEDAVAFGVLAGHNQPEALPKDALNALEGHLRGFAGVGVEHREGFAGVEDQTDGVEVTAAKEQVVTDVVVITRVVAAQHLAWEGEPSTAKRHGDVESCLFEALAKGGEEVKVLDGADQSKFHVGQRRGSADGIEEALLRFFFGQGSIAASFEALPRTFTVGV